MSGLTSNQRRAVLVCAIALALPNLGRAYPLDGYAETGIRRLEALWLTQEGVIEGRTLPKGALLDSEQVTLRMLDAPDYELPPVDPAFTEQIIALLGENADRYGIAVLDLSDPERPRYAEHRGDHRQNVGSVGKLAVALALFQALADTWPDEAHRIRVLRETVITADEFAHWDHHDVPMYDVASRRLAYRTIKDGDQASLWEYLDWMLSPSSNAAAGMVMRDAMLMRQYGRNYPPPEAEISRFFSETPKKSLTALYERTFFEPLERNGFDLEHFRQASFFTRQGKAKVPGPGGSYATARELMKYGLRMEQGRLVDAFSSLQIKRLLYITERRIRYASSPALADAAVYFKSGSLYSCEEEPDFRCGKYMGNVRNYMNSFAIIEQPAGERRLEYMVMLISNVLRKNSAYDHQTLATQIHNVIDAAHPAVAGDDAAPSVGTP